MEKYRRPYLEFFLCLSRNIKFIGGVGHPITMVSTTIITLSISVFIYTISNFLEIIENIIFLPVVFVVVTGLFIYINYFLLDVDRYYDIIVRPRRKKKK